MPDTTGLTFQRERAHELYAEALPLFEAHRQEISHYQDIPLGVDVESYKRVEEANGLRCYTARKDRELIGYCVYFIRHNPHYMTSKQAVQDVLFIRKEYRQGWMPVRFIRYTERELKAEGTQVVYHHVKAASPVGRLMEAMHYDLVDLIYAKRLD